MRRFTRLLAAVLAFVVLTPVASTARAQTGTQLQCTDDFTISKNGVSFPTRTCSIPKGVAVSSPVIFNNVLPNPIPAGQSVIYQRSCNFNYGQNLGSDVTATTVCDVIVGPSAQSINLRVSGIVSFTDSDSGSTCNGQEIINSYLNYGLGPAPDGTGLALFSKQGAPEIATFGGTLPTSQAFLFLGANFVEEDTCVSESDYPATAIFHIAANPRLTLTSTQKNIQTLGTSSITAGDALTAVGLFLKGAGAAATGIGSLVDSALGKLVSNVAFDDPPDLNYTVVTTPTNLSIDTSSFPPALSQLTQTLAQMYGLGNAIETTVNRTTGAILSGDGNSVQLQMDALPGFEDQLLSLANELPAQYAAVGQEIVSEGFDPASITLAQVMAIQQHIQANGLSAEMVSELNSLGITDPGTQQDIATAMATADPTQVESILQSRFAAGPLFPPSLPASSNIPVVAAVLPASRSAVVNNTITAFATIINAGTNTATACGILGDANLPINVDYQTTNPATNAVTGTPNTPVNIAPGAAQSFVIAATPTATLGSLNADFSFFCSNANAAPVSAGLNTLLLSASTTPVPDVVALAASGDPGIVDVSPTTNAGVFAVATVNLGSGDQITATTDTNGTTLPLVIDICQTNPATSACLNGSTPAPSVTTQINGGDTPTFGIFVSGTGGTIPFDPANNRVFVRFTDSTSTVRGATSVAVRTH